MRLALFVLLALVCVISTAEEMTIDEMIAAASTVTSLDYLTDLDGKTVMQELDMVLTLEQWNALQEEDKEEMSSSPEANKSREKRKAVKNTRYRWTNKIIPYRIAPGVFSSRDRSEIQRAINEWQQYTCLRFTPASSHKNYVYFDNGSGCYSYVGMTGGSQTIGLAGGCRHKGVIVHEIGHAVGFHHEQNRPDRDRYVRILRQNIPQQVYYNFKKYPYSAINLYDVPYDYGSAMHYGSRAFSRNGQLTIQTINSADQNKIGNRQGLSFRDIKLANLMYSCSDRCPNIKCPGEGFVGKDCTCYCPGNPVKRCHGGTGTGGKTTTTTRRPVVTTKKPCRNLNRKCTRWAREGYCGKSTYMFMFCKPACNMCGTTRPPCINDREHCDYWASKGFCKGEYKSFMMDYCKKACNYCRSSSSSSSFSSSSSSSSSSYSSSFAAQTNSSSETVGFEAEDINGSAEISAGFWACLFSLVMLAVASCPSPW